MALFRDYRFTHFQNPFIRILHQGQRNMEQVFRIVAGWVAGGKHVHSLGDIIQDKTKCSSQKVRGKYLQYGSLHHQAQSFQYWYRQLPTKSQLNGYWEESICETVGLEEMGSFEGSFLVQRNINKGDC